MFYPKKCQNFTKSQCKRANTLSFKTFDLGFFNGFKRRILTSRKKFSFITSSYYHVSMSLNVLYTIFFGFERAKKGKFFQISHEAWRNCWYLKQCSIKSFILRLKIRYDYHIQFLEIFITSSVCPTNRLSATIFLTSLSQFSSFLKVLCMLSNFQAFFRFVRFIFNCNIVWIFIRDWFWGDDLPRGSGQKSKSDQFSALRAPKILKDCHF